MDSVSETRSIHLGALPKADSLSLSFLQGLCGRPSNVASLAQLERAEILFAEYYIARCQEFLSDGKIHISVRTFDDVRQIAREIASKKSRKEILDGIEADCPAKDKLANTTLDLCASLLVMTEVGTQDFRISTRECVPWKSGTLQDCLRLHFTPERALDVDGMRMNKVFTAHNLSRIGGIRLCWTDNLADHLRLADDDETVFVFHHASFLKFQQSLDDPVLPRDFITETIRTFSLLFPQNDAKTRAWLKSLQRKGTRIDSAINECGSPRAHERDLDTFSIWHTRLVILKQAFDDAQPQTLAQWLWDRRDGVQWYTFWVAILVLLLTVFFGLVQTVEGAIQVYYAVQDHNNSPSTLLSSTPSHRL